MSDVLDEANIWQCTRRRCGWKGSYSELRQAPDRGGWEARCPRCGRNEFYVRDKDGRPIS